jgi:hypothetical protein
MPQGGAGLVQKVRLAIQLSEGDGNIRYFTVVKGNYCPKEYKQNSMELLFSEENFLFSFTGKIVPTSELGNDPLTKGKQPKSEQLEAIAMTVFQDKSLSYTDFVHAFCELTNKSEPTAKRVHKSLKYNNIIIESNGHYRLAKQSAAFNTEDNNIPDPNP